MSPALRQRPPMPRQIAELSAICAGLKSSFCVSIMSGAVTYCAPDARRTALFAVDSPEARPCARAMPARPWPNLGRRGGGDGWRR